MQCKQELIVSSNPRPPGYVTGRPTKYNPDYCDKIIQFMMEGRSFVQFAASIGVHLDTLLEWCKVHPEFSLAYKRAKVACEAYWEERARLAMDDRSVNTNLLKFYLAARFGWSEKTETVSTLVVRTQEDMLRELE